ncbi:DNRLRE domain-containing protein [Archangium primigenium]|uniref:DNRLRE domain-containing protein n=1 Tax=[Archangium] primigenium TaxID=2792470 RepID=UPI0019582161|nr:DNRLRE domain-containing protein [Archangium primigenium]
MTFFSTLSSTPSRRFLSWRSASLSAVLALATGASAAAPVQDIRAETPVLAQDVIETAVFTSDADAMVDAKYPTTNFGTQTYLATSPELSSGYWSRHESFVRFDLSGLPRSARVLSVRFTLTSYQGISFGADENVYTHLVADDTWRETDITWANRPDATGESLGQWRVKPRLGGAYSVYLEDSITTDALVDAVQGEIEGDGQLSLRVSAPWFYSVYISRESPYKQAYPRLEITYQFTPPSP